jgi:hypothetical protein
MGADGERPIPRVPPILVRQIRDWFLLLRTGFSVLPLFKPCSPIEGHTGQTPKPLNRPASPYQNSFDFSKWLGSSKNFAEYKEHSNYRDHRVIFLNLWR